MSHRISKTISHLISDLSPGVTFRHMPKVTDKLKYLCAQYSFNSFIQQVFIECHLCTKY